MSVQDQSGGAANSGAAPPTPVTRKWWRPELGFALAVLALGVFVLVDTRNVSATSLTGPGPRFFPMLIGAAVVLIGVFYTIDVLRGGHGDPEEGEDVDSTAPTDWKSLGLVSLVFLGFVLLVTPLGWVIASGLLFFGMATVLGAKHPLRTVAISVILAFGSYFAFAKGLGVTLPAGVLEGLI
ncbi:tripartite tricarboxylate transporter TctB family protein [Sinosporangium siamense]|uniref:Membrane protein n=1 Tax=Sinosporangium siamense TaxID=1367973 RepID=A0A919V7Y3_9ACTN|nr:tripartite tricarboxylate transporter TctB family protein [Sinosporangium siamense]GII92612.1 membrane protein [Sinosporangium siamense]